MGGSAEKMIYTNNQNLDKYNLDCPFLSYINIKENKNIPIRLFPWKYGSNYVGVYYHGNDENIDTIQSFVSTLSFEMKMNIIAIEYPGYGKYKSHKEGKQKSKAILNNTDIIHKYIQNKWKYDEQNIIPIGQSLGCSPALYHAATHTTGPILLISPFLSLQFLIREKTYYLTQRLVSNTFDNENFARNVKSPILLIHGKKDTLIPIHHSKELFRILKTKKKIIEVESGHNDIDPEVVSINFVKFLLE